MFRQFFLIHSRYISRVESKGTRYNLVVFFLIHGGYISYVRKKT